MVKLTIKKTGLEKTIDCDFAGKSFVDSTFTAQFEDTRRFPEIAEDFDQLDQITVMNFPEEQIYTGYTRITQLMATQYPGHVFIRLEKE